MARKQTREEGDTGMLIHIGKSGKSSLKKLAKKRSYKNPKQFAEAIINDTIYEAEKSGEIKAPTPVVKFKKNKPKK